MKKQHQNPDGASGTDTNSSTISLSSSIAFFFLLSVILHICILLLLRVSTHLFDLPDPSKFKSKNIDFTLIKNPDNKQDPTEESRFRSLENSRASGKMSEQTGKNPVPTQPGKPRQAQTEKKPDQKNSGDAESAERNTQTAEPEEEGLRIPEYLEFDKERAFNISSEGNISFDTIRYENADYFTRMMERIKRNWFNIYFGLIHPGEVEIVLFINREGRLLDYRVLKHFNYHSQVNAIIQAARLASPFGPVPDTVKGDVIEIPIRFQYITR